MKFSPEFRSFQLCVKRALDIITPVAVLIVVSPLLLLVALLIKNRVTRTHFLQRDPIRLQDSLVSSPQNFVAKPPDCRRRGSADSCVEVDLIDFQC